MLIFNKDPLRAAVEAASGGRVTVLYDDRGYPSYMNVIPKFNVETIDTDLGTGVHPAFIVNGVEKPEIFIGQYKANVLDGRALSLPGYDPTASVNFDTAKGYCTAKGAGWHMMTNWEAAALALWCIKNGQPRGNTDYGRHHTSTHESGRRQDGVAPGTASGTARTLNGSGPASWRHDGTFAGIDGLCGNIYEWVDGMKLVNGKFYFPDDNYYNQLEASWKDQGVIMAEDTGDKLGVAGTDTLHAGGGVGFGAWKGLTRTAAYAALSATIKNRFQQAMIDPAFDNSNPIGYFYFNTTGEMLPFRFGFWNGGAYAGVAYLGLSDARLLVTSSVGFRLAYIG
jgi:hypothetical protein